MAKSERLDEDSLKGLLASEIRAAVAYDKGELAAKRTRALEYYQGVMTDTPPAPNRSKVVSRDVADTIGWMLPGIIRVFTASDQMAEYQPVGRGDDHFAEQATDYCNFIFWKDNPGYRILWNATHDSLLQGNGIVKHWWDDSEECEYSEHSGMTELQIALLMQDGAEVVAKDEEEPQKVTVIDQATGQPVEQEIPVWTVKLKRVTRSGGVRVDCIEPETFLIDRDATCIEDARFAAHCDEKTRSELIEMGFSRDIVDDLPSYSTTGLKEEQLARKDDFSSLGQVGHRSTELIEVYECYVKADANGDGIAETIRAYYAGSAGSGELLDWEVWDDDLPFSDIPCEPVPHRWDARSVADETVDIQQAKTTLFRGLLNNLYWTNDPMREAEIDSVVNPEMLTTPTFGATIWRKKGSMATAPIKTLDVPFIADKVLLGLEHLDQVTEKRTGVSRATMALDPETLQNQTATASQNQKDASYSQIELIARNQAELGWKRVFKMILRLVVKHQDRPRMIRLRDEPVEMDPRFWNAGMDVTINTGLGTGSRDRDMAMLNNILQTQSGIAQQLAGSGFADKAIDMLPKIIKTATKLAESSGIRNPDEYYPEYDENTIAQMKKALAEKAAQGDPKVQAEKEKAAAQLQIDAQKNQADIILQREKMQGEFALKQQQMAGEFALKQFQIVKEMELKERLSMHEMTMKRDVGFYSADAKASSQVHMGGRPG